MTDPEQLLGDALQERASTTTYAPTAMADVVSTARGIRRHQRRRGALLAAAAVLAVLVPTAIVLGQDQSRSLQPAGSPSATSSASSSATPMPGLDSLESGPAPKADYLDGTTYVGYDGARTRLPAQGAQGALIGVTPYHGGFLLTSVVDLRDTFDLFQYDNAGQLVDQWQTTGPPVISADGTEAAWVTVSNPETNTAVIHRGISSGMGEGETTQDVARAVELVGIMGRRVVYTDLAHTGAWLSDLVGRPQRIPGLTSVGAVDNTHGWVAGARDDGTSAVVDPDTGEVVWSTSDFELSSFSPDGAYVVGLDPSGSGGYGYAVLDAATGNLVSRLDLFGFGPKAVSHTWEDDQHLLIDALGPDDTEAIVRAGLDGHLTLATPLRPGSEDPRYVFAAHP